MNEISELIFKLAYVQLTQKEKQRIYRRVQRLLKQQQTKQEYEPIIYF